MAADVVDARAVGDGDAGQGVNPSLSCVTRTVGPPPSPHPLHRKTLFPPPTPPCLDCWRSLHQGQGPTGHATAVPSTQPPSGVGLAAAVGVPHPSPWDRHARSNRGEEWGRSIGGRMTVTRVDGPQGATTPCPHCPHSARPVWGWCTPCAPPGPTCLLRARHTPVAHWVRVGVGLVNVHRTLALWPRTCLPRGMRVQLRVHLKGQHPSVTVLVSPVSCTSRPPPCVCVILGADALRCLLGTH